MRPGNSSGSYELNREWVKTKPSNRIGNLTSQLPTIFCILKSKNFAVNPSFWIIRAYLRAANRESSSLFAPVHTIFPDEKIKAVVLGSRIRIITAAKRFGLYSALRACKAIFLRSSLQFKFTVDTIFLRKENKNNSLESVEWDWQTRLSMGNYCSWGKIAGSDEPGVIGVIGVCGPINWWIFTLGKFSLARSVIGTIGDIRLCCINENTEVSLQKLALNWQLQIRLKFKIKLKLYVYQPVFVVASCSVELCS